MKITAIKAKVPPFKNNGNPVNPVDAQKIADEIELTFQETVETWREENKPDFRKEVRLKKDSVIIRVFTQSEIYNYVVLGTKPHPIKPKPDNKLGLLVFREKYKRKSSSRSRKALKGGSSGGLVFAKEIPMHPGNKEPAMYHVQLAKYWAKKFPETALSFYMKYFRSIGAS